MAQQPLNQPLVNDQNYYPDSSNMQNQTPQAQYYSGAPQQQQQQAYPQQQGYMQQQQQQYPPPPTVYQDVQFVQPRDPHQNDEQTALIILIIGILFFPLLHFANCGYLKSPNPKARTIAKVSMAFIGIGLCCFLFSFVLTFVSIIISAVAQAKSRR